MKKKRNFITVFSAYVLVFVLTILSADIGMLALPGTAEPVEAAEMPYLVKTYNMVRLDDVLGDKNPSNHNYNPKYDSAYGYLTSCSHGPADGGNYWYRVPVSIYGYYDDVLGTYVQTTIKRWSNEKYDCDDGHSCSEAMPEILRYKDMPDALTGCHVTTRPCDNILLQGASFVFSDSDNCTGTVTVYYAEECTIASALNSSYVLSAGGKNQNVTLQNSDGSASQIIYTSRYSIISMVSSAGCWLTPHWNSDRKFFAYSNETSNGGENSTQRYQLTDAGNGYVYIKNEAYGTYLTVDSNNVGSMLHFKEFNGSDYQKFKIIRSGCQITFNPENNGTASTKVAKYGTSDASTGVTGLTYGTYVFQGWYTKKNGGGEMVYDASGLAKKGTYWSADGTSAKWLSTADSLELYAYWRPGKQTQTLYFYKDGTVDKSKTKTYQIEYGATFKISDYYDVSMSPFANCHYVSTSKSSWTVTKAASANIYYATNELDIIYNGNGSTSGSTAGTSVKYGATVTAARNGFTRTGYSFVSWNTNADGSGTSYAPGNTFTAQPKTHGEQKVLYAIWKDVTNPTITVSPDSTAGWTVPQQITITAADNAALSSDTKYEYCLTENDQTPDGDWKTYSNGHSFTIGTGLSGEYYLWVRAVSDTAGNVSSQAGYHKFGPYYFDNAAPDLSNVKSTYGWFDSGSCPKIDFDITDTESGIKSIVINDINGVELADITEGTHRFQFNADGINFYNVIATDNLDNVSKKMFAVKIGTSTEVPAENAVWKGLSNLVLYQSWLPITYTIRFDRNDDDSVTKVTGTMDDVPAVYDAPLNLPENRFARDGYEFIGWNTKADGSGQSFVDKDSVVNLSSVNKQVVTLYAQWNDNTVPVITVTPTHTENTDTGVENNAVKKLDVTISIEEHGAGLSKLNKYEYALTTSKTDIPDAKEWKEYATNNSSILNIMGNLNDLGEGLTGQYYLWIRQISDNNGNNAVVNAPNNYIQYGNYHIFGIYNFDNTAPTGNVTYTEDFDGYFNEYLNGTPNSELFSYLDVYDGIDNEVGSGVKRFFARIANKANPSEFVELLLQPQNSNRYSVRFNLYTLFGENAKSIDKYVIVVYAEDQLGNIARLKVVSTEFGDDISPDDIGFNPTEIKDADNTLESDFLENPEIKNASDDDPVHFYERDSFRVDAVIYDSNGKYKPDEIMLTGGSYAKLIIFTFGNVESIATSFDQTMKNTLNINFDYALDMYNTNTYKTEINTILYKEEHDGVESNINKLIGVRSKWSKLTWGKTSSADDSNINADNYLCDSNILIPNTAGAITTHELFIPVRASRKEQKMQYDNNVVYAFKNGKAQTKVLKIELQEGYLLDDLHTQILGTGSK